MFRRALAQPALSSLLNARTAALTLSSRPVAQVTASTVWSLRVQHASTAPRCLPRLPSALPPSSSSIARYSTTPPSWSPSSTTSTTPPPKASPLANANPLPSTPEDLAPLLTPRLHRYAPRLAALSARTGVPTPSLVVSAVILHELTAVIPLGLLFYLLRALGAGAGLIAWLLNIGAEDGDEKLNAQQVEADLEAGVPVVEVSKEEETRWDVTSTLREWYDEGVTWVENGGGRRYGVPGYEKGSKPDGTTGHASVVADAIAAYVLVKLLMPVRIAVSLRAAPAFARFALNPVRRVMAKFWR